MKKASEIDLEKIDTQCTEFQNALQLISYTNQSVFLTGKAGTGKSTFLQYLKATTKKKYVVLAPTGIAAVNAGGQTLHSFFKLPFKPLLPNDRISTDSRMMRERLKYPKSLVKLIRNLDLIIIDEVSMVRADIIDFIDRILRVYCGKIYQPFGGKQLLLVGDVFQLEPVITGDARDVLSYFYRDGAFFFNARVFSELSIVPIELTKVYRQTDDIFIRMLDRVRVGAPTQTDINVLNMHVANDAQSDHDGFEMTIATRRDIVDHINETRLQTIRRPERKFTGSITGDFPENSLPTDMELILKEGAQVVFVKNDPEKRWVNGTIGRVEDFGEDEIIVLTEDGSKHAVQLEVWDNVKYGYDEKKKKVTEEVIGSFMQFPIKLAWAITIHKSQGLTFDKVTIDVGQGAFSGGQTYVALSRCRSLDGITLRSTINPRDIFVNPKVLAFSRTFNNDSLIKNALEQARADDLYKKANSAFEKGEYGSAIDLFSQAVIARNELKKPNVQRLIASKLHSLASYKSKTEELQRRLDENAATFRKMAMEYVELGEEGRQEGWDLKAAIANFDKAISLYPSYHLAWLSKGLALAQCDEFDSAMHCLHKAAKLDQKDYRPLYEAGRLTVNSGDTIAGIDLLLSALQCNGKIPAIHLALAEAYSHAGDDEKAEAHRMIANKLKKKGNKK